MVEKFTGKPSLTQIARPPFLSDLLYYAFYALETLRRFCFTNLKQKNYFRSRDRSSHSHNI